MKFKHKTEEELQSMFLLHEGTYQFVVTKAEDAMSKSNNEMIKLTLKIMDKAGREHTVYDYLLEAMEFKLCTMVIKAVRRGVATDYCLTLKRLKREARRRLKKLIKK